MLCWVRSFGAQCEVSGRGMRESRGQNGGTNGQDEVAG